MLYLIGIYPFITKMDILIFTYNLLSIIFYLLDSIPLDFIIFFLSQTEGKLCWILHHCLEMIGKLISRIRLTFLPFFPLHSEFQNQHDSF